MVCASPWRLQPKAASEARTPCASPWTGPMSRRVALKSMKPYAPRYGDKPRLERMIFLFRYAYAWNLSKAELEPVRRLLAVARFWVLMESFRVQRHPWHATRQASKPVRVRLTRRVFTC